MYSLTMLAASDPNVISFPKLGLEMKVNSTAFTVFGASITWYGVLITFGMMLAMIYVFRRMRSFGIDSDRAIDGLIGGVIGAIVGARTYYVLFHWSDYAGDWKSIFNIRNGGLAIYGGIIGALLVGSVVCKLRKVRLLPMYDLVGLGLPIGQCIGRWGNFTNHEAFGNNTDSVFGMTSGKIASWIARNYPGGELSPDQPVHPCFFYESMWCLLGFIVLHIISKKWRKFDGQIFLMYMIWYGTGRFFIESLRTDSLYLGTLKISQVVALLSAVTGLVLLIIGLSRTKRMGSDYQLYCETEESKKLLAESDAREAAWQEKHGKKHDTAETEAEKPASGSILAEDSEPESKPEKDEQEKAEPAETEKEESSEPDEPSETESEPEHETSEPEAEEPAQPAAEISAEERAAKDAKIDALLEEIAAKAAESKDKDRDKS